MSVALPADQRPIDDTPVHTADLPPTPMRDRNIPATAWVEAPPSSWPLGDDLPGRPVATYKRRIGRWLLWRAGPATGADARYLVRSTPADDLGPTTTIPAFPGRPGDGIGPSGQSPRSGSGAWKERLPRTTELMIILSLS